LLPLRLRLLLRLRLPVRLLLPLRLCRLLQDWLLLRLWDDGLLLSDPLRPLTDGLLLRPLRLLLLPLLWLLLTESCEEFDELRWQCRDELLQCAVLRYEQGNVA
jgi:hypothetical protein